MFRGSSRPIWTKVRERPILSLFDGKRAAAEFSVDACGLLFDYSKTNIDAEGRRSSAGRSAMPNRAGRPSARRCSPARRSTKPKTARSCIRRCRNQSDDIIRFWSTAPDVMPQRHARPVSGWPTSPRRCARDSLTTPGGRAVSATLSTSASAARIWARRWRISRCRPMPTALRCHFVSNVDGAQIHDVLAGLDPATTLVDRGLEDLHHHRDDDQRRHRPRLAGGRPSAKDAAGGHLAAVSSAAGQDRKPGASHPNGCSASTIGSVAAIRSGGRSVCP